MSDIDVDSLINENNYTIDNKNKKKNKKLDKRLMNDEILEGDNDTNNNNVLLTKSNNNMALPSLMKSMEKEGNENNSIDSEYLNHNYVYSEGNANDQNKNKNLKNKKSAKIINEIKKHKNGIEINKSIFSYKIIFIYQNQDYYISVKPNSKISDIKELISQKINLDKSKIILIYKDKEIEEINKNIPINQYINFTKLKSRPIIHVKKKYINNIFSLNNPKLFKFNLLNNENKIKIINYPTMSNSKLTADEDLFNIVSEFCKNNSINSAFQIEKNDDNPDSIYHIVSFISSDIVFDFNRYFTSLKISNPIFKDTKTVMLLSKRKKNNMNKENSSSDKKRLKKKNYLEIYEQKRKYGEMKRNHLNMNLNTYINSSGPYITPYDQLKSDEKENRKKWLNPNGFISSVNKLYMNFNN